MPILLVVYPDETPEILTGISLAIVFLNAFSGSIAYGKMKRIDYKSGLLFSLATIPGAILGVYTVTLINRKAFNLIFGILLTAISIYLFLHPESNKNNPITSINKKYHERIITDSANKSYTYSFSRTTGIILSLVVGYVSSLLGIGGGIIHVPAMINLLNFPVHIATATSHFVLAIMALTGTIVHIINGSFSSGYMITISVGIGVIAGAQIGARLSSKIHGVWIVRGLALALLLVGIRLILLILI